MGEGANRPGTGWSVVMQEFMQAFCRLLFLAFLRGSSNGQQQEEWHTVLLYVLLVAPTTFELQPSVCCQKSTTMTLMGTSRGFIARFKPSTTFRIDFSRPSMSCVSP